MCLYLCVCVCLDEYVCIHVCVYVCLDECVFMYACVCVCLDEYVFMYACVMKVSIHGPDDKLACLPLSPQHQEL